MGPTLLVLAAGLGSRYGGLKQLEPVGPAGEIMLDYAVFDAWRAGFSRVVFIIRQDLAVVFRERIGARYTGRVTVDYVFQADDALPAGCVARARRTKPWGTGHAVWCARDAIRRPFAVVNADDFYGADAFVQLAHFLANPRHWSPATYHYALVGYRLDRTLSEHGAVARGICTTDAHGTLCAIDEATGITPADVGAGRKYSGAETVSMNCWGFTAELFPVLEEGLRGFLAARGDDPQAEFYLPVAVSAMLADRTTAVRVLPAAGAWFGVTYREDKPRVQAALAALVREGKYPAKLF